MRDTVIVAPSAGSEQETAISLKAVPIHPSPPPRSKSEDKPEKAALGYFVEWQLPPER